jgi:hypothetical protein
MKLYFAIGCSNPLNIINNKKENPPASIITLIIP